MSSPDNFLHEVADEVRRDRMVMLARRYGWIVVLLIVLVVGGAGAWEWHKSRIESDAQAIGDAMLDATQSDSPESRAIRLEELSLEGDAAALRDLLAAGFRSAEDSRRAATQLQAMIDDPDIRPIYRDVARLRLLQMPETALTTDQRLEVVNPMLFAGSPFRLTALELRALIHVEQRKTDDALADLTTIINDAETSDARRQRALQLLVVLGGDPSSL